MFTHFLHSHQHPLAMPVEGSDPRRRSRVAALVIGTLLVTVVGVGSSFAMAAQPATAALPGPLSKAGGHDHAAMAGGHDPAAKAAGHEPAAKAGGHDHAAMAALNASPGSPAAGEWGAYRDLVSAWSATARFHRVRAAERAGFARLPAGAPLHECIDEDVDLDDTDGAPAMGVHWINGERLDGTLRADSPEVLVYEPQADGTLDLVAVEYVVFDTDWAGRRAPKLFGRQFHHVTAPNRYGLPAFYALHAWIWKYNPTGMFQNMNPKVTCANASAVS